MHAVVHVHGGRGRRLTESARLECAGSDAGPTPTDAQVEHRPDRLYEETVNPEKLPTAHFARRSADQISERDRRDSQGAGVNCEKR